jgi:hypothetical protein
MQLTAQLFILAYELGVFLFELADAQRWWWKGRYLFGRECKRRLELRHRLLELYNFRGTANQRTSTVSCAGGALPARCRPFVLRDASLGPLHYDCARGGHRQRTGYWLVIVPWCFYKLRTEVVAGVWVSG